jgi:hypothetical protein
MRSSAREELRRSSYRRIQSDSVVHGIVESLLASEVPLRRLDGNVSKEDLDLLQLSACLVAEACAGSAEVAIRSSD